MKILLILIAIVLILLLAFLFYYLGVTKGESLDKSKLELNTS